MGSIPTLYDALQLTPELAHGMASKQVVPDNPEKIKYRCKCGCYCFAFQFHDVTTIAGIDGNYICDGCYTKLERNLEDVDGLGKPKTKREFQQRYLTIHNAPAAEIEAIGKRFDINGEYERVEINRVSRAVYGGVLTHDKAVEMTGKPPETIFKIKKPGEEVETDLGPTQSVPVVAGMKVQGG